MQNSSLLGIVFILFSSIAFSQNRGNLKTLSLKNNKYHQYSSGTLYRQKSEKEGKDCLLKGIRSSAIKGRKFERIVFDFSQEDIPNFYFVNSEEHKTIFMDFSQCRSRLESVTLKNTTLIKGVSFYQLNKDNLSFEFQLKKVKKTEVFYLTKPTRIVVDIQR